MRGGLFAMHWRAIPHRTSFHGLRMTGLRALNDLKKRRGVMLRHSKHARGPIRYALAGYSPPHILPRAQNDRPARSKRSEKKKRCHAEALEACAGAYSLCIGVLFPTAHPSTGSE